MKRIIVIVIGAFLVHNYSFSFATRTISWGKIKYNWTGHYLEMEYPHNIQYTYVWIPGAIMILAGSTILL